MPYRTRPHLPTIFAFPVSLWYYSRWHHLHDDETIRYRPSRSPEASEHPLPSSTPTSSVSTTASVLPRATSYFRPIDSHDHYVSRPSRFRAHWGQGVVSWASTLQVCREEMDKVPSQYPPSIPQVHSEFSKPNFLQFSQHRKWSVHSQCLRSCDWDFPIRKILGMFKNFPKNITVMFPSGSFKEFFMVSPAV